MKLNYVKIQIYLSELADEAGSNGCDLKIPRPPNIISLADTRPSWILMIFMNAKVDDCETHEKILNVQKAGYAGLILVSESSYTDVELLRLNTNFQSKFDINVSFIRKIDGINLRQFVVKTRHSKR